MTYTGRVIFCVSCFSMFILEKIRWHQNFKITVVFRKKTHWTQCIYSWLHIFSCCALNVFLCPMTSFSHTGSQLLLNQLLISYPEVNNYYNLLIAHTLRTSSQPGPIKTVGVTKPFFTYTQTVHRMAPEMTTVKHETWGINSEKRLLGGCWVNFLISLHFPYPATSSLVSSFKSTKPPVLSLNGSGWEGRRRKQCQYLSGAGTFPSKPSQLTSLLPWI